MQVCTITPLFLVSTNKTISNNFMIEYETPKKKYFFSADEKKIKQKQFVPI